MKKVSRLCLPSFFLFLVLFWTEAVQSECSNPSTRGDGGVRAFQGGGDVRVGRRSQRNVLFKTSFFFFFFPVGSPVSATLKDVCAICRCAGRRSERGTVRLGQ